jgi:hypothetical protein
MVAAVPEWESFEGGATIGAAGDEGVILRDEEFDERARITLETGRASQAFAIECGVYGKMMHTRFFPSLTDAEVAYDEMKPALVALIDTPLAFEDDRSDSFEAFVERFP